MKAAIQSLRDANNLALQQQQLPVHLKQLLKSPIPHLDQTNSVAFIASDLWFGDEHNDLTAAVQEKCFHADTQGRLIIGVVQAYGCGKTKTGLRLAETFILLPIRFNVGSMGSTALADQVVSEQQRLLHALPNQPTLQEVQAFSDQCQRLCNLCLLTLLALYDHCDSNYFLDGNNARDRFYFALFLLSDQSDKMQWCRQFFDKYMALVEDEKQYNKFVNALLNRDRQGKKVVFLLDEVHVLFDKCRGYCLHSTLTPVSTPAEDLISGWRNEQTNGSPSPGHQACTDLSYQFRLVMLSYLQTPGAPVGFVMCSTMFRIWKVLQEENSPLSRGTIDPFFRLHWFKHAEIKEAVRSMFDVPEHLLNALEFAPDGSSIQPYKRLSVYRRPLFLMEYLEQLCKTFTEANLPQVTDEALSCWLRTALTVAEGTNMHRASYQIAALVGGNFPLDMWTTRRIVHLLYTTQRICGGTLALDIHNNAVDELSLESIISKGVARLIETQSRFRISDPIFAEALTQQYGALVDKNRAVLGTLSHYSSLGQALVSHDSSQKGFLTERLLAWLAISGQLNVTVFNPDLPFGQMLWTVNCSAECAGTLWELEYGTSAADEPPVLAGIMDGSLSRLLLPHTLAGPDLWMRANIDGIDSVVAVQSKVESIVYSFSKFLTALKSLDPIAMFSSSNAAAARVKWLPYIAQLQTMDYHRIIFSACGFTPEVQFAVREYNWVRGLRAADGQPRRFIHLMNLDDIKECSGAVYSALKSQLKVDIGPTLAVDACLLSHQWLKISASKRKTMAAPLLTSHCRQRGILLQKRRPQHVEAIDKFSPEDKVAERVARLDPSFA